MSVLQAFNFRRKNTVVHRLDPRTKLYMAITLLILSLIFGEVILLFLLLMSLIFVLAVARSLHQWSRTIRGLSFLLILVVLLNVIFPNPAYATYPLGYAITFIVRVLDVVTCFSIFFLTVHPDDLAQALIQLHVPFDFAFALSMSTRYVPTLAQEAQTIIDAQMSRGLELQRGNMIKRIRNYIPILIPLIVCSIRRALSVAESLESRAFGSTKRRTYLHALKMAKKDHFLILLVTLVVILSIYYKFLVGLPSWLTWQIPL